MPIRKPLNKYSNEEEYQQDYPTSANRQRINHIQTQPQMQSQSQMEIQSPLKIDLIPSNNNNKPSIAPYGMRFGEENDIRKREQMQYKEDLDYLCGLRKRYGEMSQKEWEEYNRKLNYMNDRYVYGEIDRKNFFRGMNKGYEDEMLYRKEQERLKRLNEYENERKKFEGLKDQERLENERKQEQKNKLHNELQNDLDNFYRRRNIDNQLKNEEGKAALKLIDEENRKLYEPYNQYKDKMNNINQDIYGKVYKFNGYMNEPINNEAFTAKNDYEFNKYIAEQRNKEREMKKYYPDEINRRLQEMEQEKTIGQQSQREKNDNQKLYKEYLDNQNKMNQLSKLNEPKYFGPQLLMPAYLYPNRPMALNKKAVDSLQFSKQSNKIFDKDMNKFFDWDAQYYTMMDYPQNGRYLGDSMLRHNPITCPVNDYYHNRYINQLKKRSEYIPMYDSQYNNQQRNNKNRIGLEHSASSPNHFPSLKGESM